MYTSMTTNIMFLFERVPPFLEKSSSTIVYKTKFSKRAKRWKVLGKNFQIWFVHLNHKTGYNDSSINQDQRKMTPSMDLRVVLIDVISMWQPVLKENNKKRCRTHLSITLYISPFFLSLLSMGVWGDAMAEDCQFLYLAPNEGWSGGGPNSAEWESGSTEEGGRVWVNGTLLDSQPRHSHGAARWATIVGDWRDRVPPPTTFHGAIPPYGTCPRCGQDHAAGAYPHARRQRVSERGVIATSLSKKLQREEEAPAEGINEAFTVPWCRMGCGPTKERMSSFNLVASCASSSFLVCSGKDVAAMKKAREGCRQCRQRELSGFLCQPVWKNEERVALAYGLRIFFVTYLHMGAHLFLIHQIIWLPRGCYISKNHSQNS